LSLGPKLAFPKPDDFPTSLTQQAIYGQITLTVTDNLTSPVSLIGFRRAIALRTAVPEAAVYENSNLMPRKDKIRIPRQGIATAPADETSGASNSDKPQLSCLVRFRPNSRHVRRSFRPGKPVHDRSIRIDFTGRLDGTKAAHALPKMQFEELNQFRRISSLLWKSSHRRNFFEPQENLGSKLTVCIRNKYPCLFTEPP
jgi:hypothetical protein